MDKFLWTYNLPKLNQEESENLNRQTETSEVEVVIKILLINQSPGLNEYTCKFYQTFKDKLILIRLFQKIQDQIRLLSPFCEAGIIWIPKAGRHYKEKKL